MTESTFRRNYKDSLFRMIFREKKELLSLYNALNGTRYEDEDNLEINTIEDVIYMGYKNDISFLLDDELNLYEAQSTWNPNLPLRGLFYFAKLYQGYAAERDLDLYSQVQLKIPVPRYMVLYNGTKKEPDRTELRLSDSFVKKSEDSALECIATVVNINYGCNKKLMEGCRKLYEYAYFIEEIRERVKQGIYLGAAIDRAVERCIKENILGDFLKKHRAEVKDVILTEYDEELHIRSEKAQSFQDGKEEGRTQKLLEILCKKLRKGKSLECIAEEMEEEPENIRELVEAAQQCAPEYDLDRICQLLNVEGNMESDDDGMFLNIV